MTNKVKIHASVLTVVFHPKSQLKKIDIRG